MSEMSRGEMIPRLDEASEMATTIGQWAARHSDGRLTGHDPLRRSRVRAPGAVPDPPAPDYVVANPGGSQCPPRMGVGCGGGHRRRVGRRPTKHLSTDRRAPAGPTSLHLDLTPENPGMRRKRSACGASVGHP